MSIDEKEIERCRKLAAQYPKKKTVLFLCYVTEDEYFTTPFGQGSPAYWGLFTQKQKGYEWATERIPYFTSEVQI